MTLIRVLKSHAGSDGKFKAGEIYDAEPALAALKIAAGTAEDVDDTDEATYKAGDRDTAVTTATAAVATARSAVTTAEGAVATAEATLRTAKATLRQAIIDERAAIRAAAIDDEVAPVGQLIAFAAASYQLGVDADAIAVDITGIEIDCDYVLTISSAGGGTPVQVPGTAAAADISLTGIDCSGLTAGALTASLVVTDETGNAAAPVTDAATLVAAA